LADSTRSVELRCGRRQFWAHHAVQVMPDVASNGDDLWAEDEAGSTPTG
jgi:hypothetical protein